MARGVYQVRVMTRGEMNLAVDWAAAEGWNPGLYDADCFHDADPGGFFLGLLDGKPIGSISAVEYETSYGFLGFYLVVPEYRGRGFGIQLWNAAMNRLKGRTVGLDGVIQQQANYGKSGFKLAYRNIRHRWVVDRATTTDQDAIPLSEVPGETLAAYDLQLFGFERRRFQECWITRSQTRAVGIVHGSNLAGYGVLRKCRKGFKVGPLFADSADIANRIFRSLVAGLQQGEEVFLDVPEVNDVAVRMAQAYGMTRVFETARMYAGEQPDLPLGRWFGLTSFELG
jgi:GNAT superfamily N-acetyltransferase